MTMRLPGIINLGAVVSVQCSVLAYQLNLWKERAGSQTLRYRIARALARISP